MNINQFKAVLKQNNFKNIQIVFTLSLFFTISATFAQNRIRYQADYDAKDIKFGYILGIPVNNYYIRYNQKFVNDFNTNKEMIVSPSKPGLRMGGVVNFRVDDYFDFRILPSVCIYRYELLFQKQITTTGNQTQTGFIKRTGYRENAWFELPLMVKYKSERRGNVRMYIFAGSTLAFESNAFNKTKTGAGLFKITELRTLDMSINYGVGLEMFREYFKFAPELHFSHGMRNLVDASKVTGTDYAKIDKLATHTISLNFLFE